MKNEELRPFTGSPRVRNGKSWQWEHIQIDIGADEVVDGEHPIYLFRDAGIELRAVAVDGAVIDFRAVSAADVPVLPTLPPFDLSSESYGPYRHSLVYRSWNIPSLNMTVHVESWVDKGKGGFVDVFAKRGEGNGKAA